MNPLPSAEPREFVFGSLSRGQPLVHLSNIVPDIRGWLFAERSVNFFDVEPIVNMEDPIGKTVGRRKAPDPMALIPGQKEAKRKWAAAGFFPRFPKGVFRFKTHEEADRWLMDHLIRKRES